MTEPIRIVLPFAALCPDNEKYGVAKGRMILSAKYRRAKKWVTDIGANTTLKCRWKPLQGRIALSAVVYEPDTSRTRDVSNYAKLVQDGLKGSCYGDDGQIDDARWLRGPVDEANPRMEITITELSQERAA